MMKFRETAGWKALANLPFIRNFTLPLGIFCLIVVLNVLSNGFDIAIYNTVQAMTAFQHTFGDQCNQAGVCNISSRNLSLLNSIPFITYAAALYVASELGERYGRRVVYIVMNVICLVGVAVSYTATSFGQILAGRCIVNIYTGMEGYLIPLFLAELVPANVRGAMVSAYVFGRLLGSLIIGIIAYATSTIPGDDSWKIPVAALFSIPAFALLCCWLVPESPRWLVRVGKDEQALAVLRHLNDSRPDYSAEAELAELKGALEKDVEGSKWKDLVQGHNLNRTVVASLTQFFSIAAGQAFSNTYGTIFIQSLNVYDPYAFTIIIKVGGIAGALLFSVLVDRVGRRRFWQTMAPMAMVCMYVIGAMGTIKNPTRSEKLVIASMFPCYGFFLLGSFAPLAAVANAEIPSPRLRDKTAMVGWSVSNLTNFVTAFTLPYLMGPGYASLGAKVGFIYAAIGTVGCIWAYFCYPELKGRSLEEIDIMVTENVPARHTKNWVAPATINVEHKLGNEELDAGKKNSTHIEGV